MEIQRTQKSINSFDKVEQSWGTDTDLKTYYKTTVFKTVWYCPKDRPIGPWNRIKSFEIDPHLHVQPTFNKVTRGIQWRKDSLSNKQCCNNCISVCKKKKNLYLYLVSDTSIYSKWITDLNVKPKIINFYKKQKQKKTGENLSD